MARLRLRHGDQEIEAEGTQDFIKKEVDAFYTRLKDGSIAQSTDLKKRIIDDTTKKAKDRTQSPAEFYKGKGSPKEGVAQILVFAKYLEEYKDASEFTRKEVNQVVKDAKLGKDIHGQYIANATRQGLLRSLGSGKYTLTLSGEDAVGSM